MKNVFRENARKSFWDLTVSFSDSLGESFPNCADTKDLVLWCKNVIVGDEVEEGKGIHNWYDAMMEPLKKTKYSKAVERINGSPPVIYHACVYKDFEAISTSTSSPSLTRLNISEKLTDPNFSEESRAVFWKYIDELNKNASEYTGKPFPKVPTRDEIAENIKKQKKNDSSSTQHQQPSMLKGFCTSLSAFCEVRGCKNVFDLQNEEETSKIYTKWTEISKKEVDGVSVFNLCKKNDTSVLKLFVEDFPMINWELPMEENQWTLLNKLLSFCTVGDAIPSHMMGKIESMASRLADDIMSGKADMSSMDLKSIGEEVLSQCNPNDMSHFANNIDKILPAITNLK